MNNSTKRRNKRRKMKEARDNRVQNIKTIRVHRMGMPARLRRGWKSRLI